MKKQINYNERSRIARAKKRAFIDALKSKPCTDCGGTFHPYVMDFDHRDGEQKRFNVSAAIPLGLGESAILEEVAKCDLVCSNCHRMRTFSKIEAIRLPVPRVGPQHHEKTHCPAGHPYDVLNTKVRRRYGAKLSRECITCIRERDRERWVRRRQAEREVRAARLAAKTEQAA